ncbi:MAG: hypothetical protein WBP26_03710 [Candidatus Saccharimonadales bacterium]
MNLPEMNLALHEDFMDINDPASIEQISQNILGVRAKKKRPIVFVTGLSGSGKTTLASKISQTSDKVSVISFDWWIKDSSPVRRGKIVEDYRISNEIPNPLEWYSWKKFSDNLITLQTTGTLDFQGAWDQSTGEKDLNLNLEVPDDGVIVVEGMYLFEESTRNLADYTIMIEPDIDNATKRAQVRHQSRNPEEYLAIKERWHREYDVPYLQGYQSGVDLVVKNHLPNPQ